MANGSEGGRQQALGIGGESLAVHGAVDDHRSAQAVETQARDERGGLPMTVRDSGAAAFAAPAASAQARHLGRGAGLIEKDKPGRVELGLRLEPSLALGLHVGPVLLAGVGRLFLNVTPCRR
jgi:hypothetical protein